MVDACLESSPTGRPVVRLERHLGRPPAEVWRALTDRDELNSWFPCDIVTDGWKVGATLRFIFRDGEWTDLVGTVLEYDEPRVLSFTWGAETLRFELTEEDGGTALVLTDELDPSIAARNASGWEVCLDMLEKKPTEPDVWKVHFERYVEAFVPILGDQEGPPTVP